MIAKENAAGDGFPCALNVSTQTTVGLADTIRALAKPVVALRRPTVASGSAIAMHRVEKVSPR
jgi:hypothetical protein